MEPAKISGYVFQDGSAIVVQQGDPSPDIPALRDGKLTSDDTRLSGVTLILCDGSGVPMLDSQGNTISTVTDANGYYEFDGLSSGLYSVKEDRPTGYQPGVDTVGSLGGTVINKYDQPDSGVIQSLSLINDPTGVQGFDFSGMASAAITSIYVDPGTVATDYNFSEVLVKTTPVSSPPDTHPSPPSRDADAGDTHAGRATDAADGAPRGDAFRRIPTLGHVVRRAADHHADDVRRFRRTGRVFLALEHHRRRPAPPRRLGRSVRPISAEHAL